MNRILFFTNSELGQANVILTVAEELAQHGEFEVHIASFASLSSRVALLKGNALRPRSNSASSTDTGIKSVATVTFHGIPLKSMEEALNENFTKQFPHPPGLKGALSASAVFPEVFAYWDDPYYIEIVEYCKEFLSQINPAISVVESTFAPGMDACKFVGRKYMVLTPIGLRELVKNSQPWMAALWKIPA